MRAVEDSTGLVRVVLWEGSRLRELRRGDGVGRVVKETVLSEEV